MKKGVFLHVLVMATSLFAASWLAGSLVTEQGEIARTRSELSKAPLGGLNKFASDIQWMLFVNYCGSIRSVTDQNVDEVCSRLDSVLKNDPDFEKAYYIGGLMLSVQAPVRSANLLMSGARNERLSYSWRIPSLAGYVLAHNVKDKDMPGRLKKAEDMFRLAIKNAPEYEQYLVSAYLRVRAERIKRSGQWQGIPLKNDRHAYLCACYDEWRKAYALAKERGTFYVVSVWNSNEKAREMLLHALQQAKIDAPADKDVLKTVRIVVRSAFSDKCLCPRCLTPYAPGDKFCSECGSAVEVYGVCPDCGSVIKGDYCSKCGRRVKK